MIFQPNGSVTVTNLGPHIALAYPSLQSRSVSDICLVEYETRETKQQKLD